MSQVPLRRPPKLSGKYMGSVLESGFYTSGPVGERLKEKLGEFLGRDRRQFVLTGSATSGLLCLLAMLRARGLRDVMICESTWPGCRLAIEQAGCRRVTSGPQVRILTDIGGARLSEEDAANDWSASVTIHDCAHSFMPRTEADYAIMSFYNGKLVSGGEGGVVLCRRVEDAEELALWAYTGLHPGAAARGDAPAVPGYKANLPDMLAALACEAVDLAPGYVDQIDEGWCTLNQAAYWLGLGGRVRQQPVRAYLFQLMYDFKVPPPVPVWARNFAPANLLTLPCFPGLTKAQARDILTPFAP